MRTIAYWHPRLARETLWSKLSILLFSLLFLVLFTSSPLLSPPPSPLMFLPSLPFPLFPPSSIPLWGQVLSPSRAVQSSPTQHICCSSFLIMPLPFLIKMFPQQCIWSSCSTNPVPPLYWNTSCSNEYVLISRIPNGDICD